MSSEYFPTYSVNSKSIKIKLDLSNYATKTYLKNLNADTSTFALKTNLADLKTRVDEIDVNKINDIDALRGKNFIEESYLVFEPRNRYFETYGTNDVFSWKSSRLSDEKTKQTNNTVLPELSFDKEKIYLKFIKDFLTQEKVTYTYDSIVNICVAYSIPGVGYSVDSDIMVDCLCSTASVINNKYTGYGISFGAKLYLYKNSGKGASNLIILGINLSSCSHAENKKNSILVLGQGSVRINNTTIKAEDELKTKFTEQNKKCVLSLHDNGDDLLIC